MQVFPLLSDSKTEDQISQFNFDRFSSLELALNFVEWIL